MGLPTAAQPGYRRFRGHVACDEQAIWLSWLELCYLKHGVVKYCIDVLQLVGGYVKSGGTHLGGAASDLAQLGPLAISISRHGCGAAWPRDHAHGGFSPHQHVVIQCPHSRPHCEYQWEALADGFDGLGRGGRGGRDYVSAPLAPGDWAEGVRRLRRLYYCGWITVDRRAKVLTTSGGPSARVKGHLRKGHRIYLTGNRSRGHDGTVRVEYRTRTGTAWAVALRGTRDIPLPR